LLLGFNSGTFLGEVGDGAGGAWLAMDVLIDVGRTLFVRRRPELGTVAVILLLRVCPCGCAALTLVERARPLALEVWEVDSVDGARLWPLSAAGMRALDGVVVFMFLCGSCLAMEALLCIDCVRVCDRVDGALPSWLDAGTLVDRPRASLDVGGGGIALRSACRAASAADSSDPSRCGISGSRFSLSTTSASFLCSAETLLGNCGSRLSRFDLGTSAFVGVGRPENPGCRMFSGSVHRVGSMRAVSGTSIIEVGLLRPAAAPGGRRVEGSRLGVAMLRLFWRRVTAVGGAGQHAGVKVMLFMGDIVHCFESALAEMTSKGHACGSNGSAVPDFHFHFHDTSFKSNARGFFHSKFVSEPTT